MTALSRFLSPKWTIALSQARRLSNESILLLKVGAKLLLLIHVISRLNDAFPTSNASL